MRQLLKKFILCFIISFIFQLSCLGNGLDPDYFEMERRKSVLVLGGGGIRGVIPAWIVRKLEMEDLAVQIRTSCEAIGGIFTCLQDQIEQEEDPSEEGFKRRLGDLDPTLQEERVILYGRIMRAYLAELHKVMPHNDLGEAGTPLETLKRNALSKIQEEIQPLLDHLHSLIDTHNRVPLYKIFATISGTSTGALIAAGLTTPNGDEPPQPKLTPDEILYFYEESSFALFPSYRCSCCCRGESFQRHCVWPLRGSCRRIKKHLTYDSCEDCSCRAAGACCWYGVGCGCVGEACAGVSGDCLGWSLCRKCQRCCGSQYDHHLLEDILEKQLGNVPMQRAMSHLQVTTHNLEDGMLFYFNTHKTPGTLIRHVVRGSSAAPTFFEGAEWMDAEIKRIMADGGLGDNSPILAALVYALQQANLYVQETEEDLTAPAELEELPPPGELPIPHAEVSADPQTSAGASGAGVGLLVAEPERVHPELDELQEFLEPLSVKTRVYLEDLFVVSFDTGQRTKRTLHLKKSGCLGWLMSLQEALKLLGESNHSQLEEMMGDHYIRFQPQLSSKLTSMDKPSNAKKLKDFIEGEFIPDQPLGKKYKELLSKLPGGHKYTIKVMDTLWGRLTI